MQQADVAVTRLAARQVGLVTRPQVLTAGLSADQLKRRLSSGLLVASQRGVYRLGGAPQSFEQTLLAACLAAGPRAVASHRSAALLWRLRDVEARVLEITVPGGGQPRLRGARVHRTRQLDRFDVTRLGRIPVTRPTRTLLGLAAVAPEVVEGALDDALVRELVTVRALIRFLERTGARGRDGTARLRNLVRQRLDGQAATESALEDAFVRLLREAGLPPPVRQYAIRLPGRPAVRLDFAYPSRRLAVEVDGRRWHSARADVERDRSKSNLLAALGWRLLRFGWSDVRDRRGHLAATVAHLLRAEGA